MADQHGVRAAALEARLSAVTDMLERAVSELRGAMAEMREETTGGSDGRPADPGSTVGGGPAGPQPG